MFGGNFFFLIFLKVDPSGLPGEAVVWTGCWIRLGMGFGCDGGGIFERAAQGMLAAPCAAGTGVAGMLGLTVGGIPAEMRLGVLGGPPSIIKFGGRYGLCLGSKSKMIPLKRLCTCAQKCRDASSSHFNFFAVLGFIMSLDSIFK